ncbi:MAG: glycosyltransferase [Desulfosporosinus sp.]
MKNILLVIPTLSFGGCQKVACETVSLLKEKYNVSIVVFTLEDAKLDPDCRIVNLNIPPANSFLKKVIITIKRVIALRRIKKKLGIDISYSFCVSASLVNVMSRCSDKIIISIHGYSFLPLTFVGRLLWRIVYTKADAILAVSNQIANKLNSLIHCESKTFCLYNPYDIEEIRNKAEAIPCAGILTPSITSMGRVENIKGFRHLINSFAIVSKSIPELKLYIVGDGMDTQKLQDYVYELNLVDKVIFLGYQDNPFSSISKCSLYILSSISEGLPNALIEAMICGMPVISTDCKSGPREILNTKYQEKTTETIEWADFGVLVPPFLSGESDEPKNEGYLADAIICLLTDNDKYQYYQKQATQRSLAFSKELHKVKLHEIIANIAR